MQDVTTAPERWAAVTALREQALLMEDKDRARFLRSASNDPKLIAEVEQLLGLEADASVLFPVGQWMDAILLKALRKEPRQRYESVAASWKNRCGVEPGPPRTG